LIPGNPEKSLCENISFRENPAGVAIYPERAGIPLILANMLRKDVYLKVVLHSMQGI